MYAVCKNGKCAQTYLLEEIIKGRSEEVFLKDIKITKGYRCKKCKGIVVDLDGKATLSQHPDIRKFITVEELEEQKKQEYKEARRKLKEAHDVFERLNKEYADF
ncbi:hypothetical protein ACQKNX_07545 [Lysinibacillus sp. NPDC093712]|uniref:hypothetical protein n=1 Tax=Lysinibacillus sp. NPDC093712 TaxID=3390579 RepID=UPI003D011C5F